MDILSEDVCRRKEKGNRKYVKTFTHKNTKVIIFLFLAVLGMIFLPRMYK